MSEVVHKKPDFVSAEVRKITNYMIENSVTSYKVDTSEGIGWDRNLHRNFPRVAHQLRQQGLKVRSFSRWGVTEWTVSF